MCSRSVLCGVCGGEGSWSSARPLHSPLQWQDSLVRVLFSAGPWPPCAPGCCDVSAPPSGPTMRRTPPCDTWGSRQWYSRSRRSPAPSRVPLAMVSLDYNEDCKNFHFGRLLILKVFFCCYLILNRRSRSLRRLLISKSIVKTVCALFSIVQLYLQITYDKMCL